MFATTVKRLRIAGASDLAFVAVPISGLVAAPAAFLTARVLHTTLSAMVSFAAGDAAAKTVTVQGHNTDIHQFPDEVTSRCRTRSVLDDLRPQGTS